MRRKGFILTLALAVIGFFVFLLILSFIYIQKLGGGVKVSGEAMRPNYTEGQNYLVNIFSYKFNEPKRGDVVVIEVPNSFFRVGSAKKSGNSKTKLLKRIVALPTETINFKDGYVYVNGTQLTVSYLLDVEKTNGEPEKIASNMYFLLGDNRTRSTDSRIFGSVPKDDIIGKLLFCYSKCNP